MLLINRKKLCANCFRKIKSEPCAYCGYSRNACNSEAGVLPRGTRLNGKYLIGGVIGRGGFGITYLAFDKKNEKIIAVKEYFPASIALRERGGLVSAAGEKSAYEDGLERFSEESGRVAEFNGNPNIVSVFECFRENGTAYYAMEYLRGITLEKYIERHGALSVEQTVFLAERLALALAVVHSAGLLHRDVAPDNIMLCEDGKIKLLDFGAARKVSGKTSLTVVVKAGFTSTEQYSSGTDITPRTDIYSLGMVMFYALTEKKPPSVFSRMENDSSFSESLWAVPSDLRSVTEKAAALNSAERFGSAADFLKALSDLKIRSESIEVRQEDCSDAPSCTAESRPTNRKIPYFLAFLAGIMLCLICFAAFVHRESYAVNVSDNPPANAEAVNISDNPPANAETDRNVVAVAFDSFEGNMSSQYVGMISAQSLKNFGGSVKITLEIETYNYFMHVPYTHIIYPIDSNYRSMVEYCTADFDCFADGAGGVFISEGAEKISFVLSHDGIDQLDGGFGFQTFNVAIKSAVLEYAEASLGALRLDNPGVYWELPYDEAAECSVSETGGKTQVTVILDKYQHMTDWGGYETRLVPGEAFDLFDGDIKMTVYFDDMPDALSDGYKLFYIQTRGMLSEHFQEFIEPVQVYGEDGSALIGRTDTLGICPDLSLSSCTVIIPKSLTGKICGGLVFTSDNMTLTRAVIENAD